MVLIKSSIVLEGISTAITLLIIVPIFLAFSLLFGRLILHALKVAEFEGSKNGIGWNILAIIIGAIPAIIFIIIANSFEVSDSQIRGWPE